MKLQKQVMLSTEPTSFLRFLIICGNSTAVKKKKKRSESKVILGIQKGFRTFKVMVIKASPDLSQAPAT